MEHLGLVLLHVALGVLWAGGAIAVGFFIIPSVFEAGPAGAAVMAGVAKRKFPVVMTIAGLLTVLSGLRLFSLRYNSTWLVTPEGIALTLGGLLAIGGLVIGVLIQKPTAEKLGALAARLAAAGGPPSPEQGAELAALRARLARAARINAWHLLGATLLMAGHRLAAGLG